MIPEFWLTEGGQSATGALLDHIVENHSAAPILANRAASQSRLSIFILSLLPVLIILMLFVSLFISFITSQRYRFMKYSTVSWNLLLRALLLSKVP